jgi:hypothetical protein
MTVDRGSNDSASRSLASARTVATMSTLALGFGHIVHCRYSRRRLGPMERHPLPGRQESADTRMFVRLPWATASMYSTVLRGSSSEQGRIGCGEGAS